jgi:lipopolysaccharide transport system permease protein
MSLALGQALWRYRGFVFGSVKREFQARYRNSLLGAAWTVFQPLAMITVYTVVFSELMQTRLPGVNDPFAYSIYLCSGLLTWNLFTEIVQRCQTVFLDNGNMIKKLSFPRICLPTIVVSSALVNFAITFAVFMIFLLITRHFPGWVLLGVIPLLLFHVMFATGMGIVVGVLNVFFRDVGQFISILLQFWFWFTPIVYSTATLPTRVQPWIHLNPMAAFAQAYQGIFVGGTWPQWSTLWPSIVMALILCVLALALFRHRSGEMVDEL